MEQRGRALMMSEKEEEKEEDMSALLMRSPERYAYTGEATRCRPTVPWELSLRNFISVLGWPCPIQRLRVLNHLYNGLQSSGPKTLTYEWPPPHLSSPHCHLKKNCVHLRSVLVCAHVFLSGCVTWVRVLLRRQIYDVPTTSYESQWCNEMVFTVELVNNQQCLPFMGRRKRLFKAETSLLRQ